MTDSQTSMLTLCPEDGAALDALMAAGFELEGVPAELRERASRVLEVMGLLDELPTPEPGDLLVARTMQSIRDARQAHRIDRQIRSLTTPAPAMRWPELIAVAAMVLITISFIWPTVRHARDQTRQLACQANLASAAMGFAGYAAESDDALPTRQARAGDAWWHVGEVDQAGQARSNSANLFLLIRSGHVQPVVLTCPENSASVQLSHQMTDWPSADAVSYSYQNQFAVVRPRWSNGPVIAILADKNPRFGPGEFYNDVDSTAISGNHAALGGMNVLFSDGSVRWLTEPVTDAGDNLWEADGVHDYRGNESPTDVNDAFLVW